MRVRVCVCVCVFDLACRSRDTCVFECFLVHALPHKYARAGLYLRRGERKRQASATDSPDGKELRLYQQCARQEGVGVEPK